ncbi:aminotransferase class IV-domain-containing protein [Lipomyces orientalis]|uniref:Aminotransferase class IV-domain-containing protein n=1 Tax=Lipomyces orientalis TaxID=1233043 RepID=A0ACC3TH52_9ASCO
MTESDSNFCVISAIRYDPSLVFPGSPPAVDAEQFDDCKAALDPRLFFLFPRHVFRLNAAHEFFWPEISKVKGKVVTPEALLTALYEAVPAPDKCWRLRPVVSKDGHIRVEAYETDPRSDLFSGLRDDTKPETSWVVYLDSESTPQSSITMFKTTNRDPYIAARERVLPPGLPIRGTVEVLLFNKKGQVTEGSLTNVAFWRNGEWITPSSNEIGGLRGAVKAELLDRGLLREMKDEEAVLKDSIQDGEKVLLLNGIQGVTCGYVRLGPYRD